MQAELEIKTPSLAVKVNDFKSNVFSLARGTRIFLSTC